MFSILAIGSGISLILKLFVPKLIVSYLFVMPHILRTNELPPAGNILYTNGSIGIIWVFSSPSTILKLKLFSLIPEAENLMGFST